MFLPRSAWVCAVRHEPASCIMTPACYRGDTFHAWLYTRRYVCMLPPCTACFCAIFPSHVLACWSAVHHCVYSLSQGYRLCMYVCSTLGMYASTVVSTFAPCLPVTRARRVVPVSYTHLTLPTICSV